MDLQAMINHLPPELKDMIVRKTLEARRRDKKEETRAAVHEELNLFFVSTPFCEIENCYTPVTVPGMCISCEEEENNICFNRQEDLCLACLAKSKRHKLTVENEDLNERWLIYLWTPIYPKELKKK